MRAYVRELAVGFVYAVARVARLLPRGSSWSDFDLGDIEADLRAPFGPALSVGISIARRSAHAVEKKGRNDFHNYDYANAEDVLGECLRALNHGACWVVPVSLTLQQGVGGIELLGLYQIGHESGECHLLRGTFPVEPGKGRPLDKARSVADTELLAYLLRGVLGLPRVAKGSQMNERDDSGVSRTYDGKPFDCNDMAAMALGGQMPESAPVDTRPAPFAEQKRLLNEGRECLSPENWDRFKKTHLAQSRPREEWTEAEWTGAVVAIQKLLKEQLGEAD